MTEWGVVGVIIALVGFAATFLAPALKLNASITKLTVTVEQAGCGEMRPRLCGRQGNLGLPPV